MMIIVEHFSITFFFFLLNYENHCCSYRSVLSFMSLLRMSCLVSEPFDPRDAKFIIGPGGSAVKAIEAETGCRVVLNNDTHVLIITAPDSNAMTRFIL